MKVNRLFLILFLVSSVIPAGCAKSPEEKEIRKSRDTIEIVLDGIVEPSREAKIVAPVSEKITAVHVKNGRKVTRGQVIAEYDTYKLNLAYRKAMADYQKARVSSRYERPTYFENRELIANAKERVLKTYALYRNNNASLAELKSAEDAYLNILASELNSRNAVRREEYRTAKERAEAMKEVEKAALDVDKARYDYNHARITAMIDGYVTDMKLYPGQLLSNGEELGKIIDIDEVEVKGAFSPGVFRYLKRNMSVDISCMTTPPYKTKGFIRDISPVIDTESKRMSLYIPLKNQNYLLQPGDKALISIVLPRKDAEKAGIRTEEKKVNIRSEIK
jgi:multidrug resistance efflux pump